jgi:hypothetical protein
MFRIVAFSVLAGCATRHAEPSAAIVPSTPDTSVVIAEETTPPMVLPELVPVPEPVPTVMFELRRGESLAHFARWSGLPIEVIAEASGIWLEDDQLPVGTIVRLPIDPDTRSTVETKRDAHHVRRAEGWLAARGGSVGDEFYRVRTGDTAWTIARDHGDIPVWVVETYNPAVDLEALRPGQELMLPVVADMVVANDSH